jgi:hypothetical protein
MRLLNLFIWGVWVKDANCPFKLMRRDALGKVLAKIPPGCFIPMVLVSILAREMKFGVAKVEVEHLPRRGGTQSLKGLLKWVRVSSKLAAQVLSIWLAHRSYGLRRSAPIGTIVARNNASISQNASR